MKLGKFMNKLLLMCCLLVCNKGLAEEMGQYGPFRKLANNSVLEDIDAHVNPRHGVYYRHATHHVWGHECTHAINSDLRLANLGHNCFYLLNDRWYKLKLVQGQTLKDVAKNIPLNLHSPLYKTYLVDSIRDWNDMPTYLFDEWSAYINGLSVIRDYGQKDIHEQGWRAALFCVYSLCVIYTYDINNVDYDRADYIKFAQIQINRCFPLLDKKADFIYNTRLSEPESAQLKKWIVDNFGPATYLKLIGEY